MRSHLNDHRTVGDRDLFVVYKPEDMRAQQYARDRRNKWRSGKRQYDLHERRILVLDTTARASKQLHERERPDISQCDTASCTLTGSLLFDKTKALLIPAYDIGREDAFLFATKRSQIGPFRRTFRILSSRHQKASGTQHTKPRVGSHVDIQNLRVNFHQLVAIATDDRTRTHASVHSLLIGLYGHLRDFSRINLQIFIACILFFVACYWMMCVCIPRLTHTHE